MECREVVAELGAEPREIRSIELGGLVMQGLALPRGVFAGLELWDVRQAFIQERHLDLRRQSTSTLLLGLRAALEFPTFRGRPDPDRTLSLWEELGRRGVDVPRVVRGALLPFMALSIARHTLAVVAGMAFAEEPLLDSQADRPRPPDLTWADILRAMADSLGDAEAWPRDCQFPHPLVDKAVHDSDSFDGLAKESHRADREAEVAELVKQPLVRLSMSYGYVARVEEWLSRLSEEDTMSLLGSSPPPTPVFLALPASSPETRDEEGLWLWERFTVTDPSSWTTSSLVLEQRWNADADASICATRVLRERALERQSIADLVLDRVTHQRPRQMPELGLHPGHFVGQAADLLREGNITGAADIFGALAELRPGDAEALNNYGFCLLPIDPQLAFEKLQEASLRMSRRTTINTANAVLALHLLGRNQEALALGSNAEGPDHPAYVWLHGVVGPPRLDYVTSPLDYLGDLMVHIEAESRAVP